MKIISILIISLILLIGLSFISTISAQDSSDLNVTDDSMEIDVLKSDESSQEILDESCCDAGSNESQTWIVEPDPDNPNQVQKPTVQPTIDKAKPGDTIVLNGTFVHCHFMINKTLTIIATPGTSVGVCPHHTHMMKYGVGPESNGIFYISPEANGTVLKGFSFTNDFYYIANEIYNPFGVYVDADNVILDNLTFNWIGVKNANSNYDPKDFLFRAIILNNTCNVSISNILIGNLDSFIESVNSSNISSNNITVIKEEIKAKIDSKIISSDLNIFVGDDGNLKASLKDANNNALSNKNITIIIDGAGRTVTADNAGIITLPVKYASAGTHYVSLYFAGDGDYNSCILTSRIAVAKKSTALTVQKATLKVKKAKKIAVTLKSNGKVISGKKVTVKVNGKTFSGKTNAKGVAYVKVKLAKKGSFKYVAKFAGDAVYNSISKTGKIIVKK